MNSKEYREFVDVYCSVYEQVGVKVPAGATDAEALKGLIPKGEKVHEVPKKKPSLQNASYEPEGEEYLDEAPIASRNYGDPKAAAWNRGYAVYRTAQNQGREMTPPSIPSGYKWNQQAGTITRGGAAPSTSSTAKPRPTASAAPASGNLRGLSVGPGGFNINNKPVRTTPPVTPNARRDPEFRTTGPGVGNVSVNRPASPAAARPAAPAAARPATASYSGATAIKPVGTSVSNSFKPVASAPSQNAAVSVQPKPVAQPLETRIQASAGQIRGMVGSSMARQAATSTPQLSARAQTLKSGGPQGSARSKVLNQDLDLFDIIKGHLLDEGYADTEESALVIMANMSDEWKQSIIEAQSTETVASLGGRK